MLHSSEIKTELRADPVGEMRTATAETETQPVLASARALPPWAAILSVAFSLGAGLCLISVAVLAVFFQSLVAEQSQTLLALLLGVVGLVPVLGMLLFDYAHIRSLAGYRVLREARERKAKAGLAAFAGIVLGLLHPLLCLGILATGVLAAVAGRILARRSSAVEPFWDTTPAEAAALLAGRDAVGFRLATTGPDSHAVGAPLGRALQWTGVLVTLALASFLAGIGHLTTAAVPGVTLIGFWASGALAEHLLAPRHAGGPTDGLTHEVNHTGTDERDMSPGLHVKGLNVIRPDGTALLSNVNLEIEPGQVIGVSGPAGSGKSLLLEALSGPYDLAGLDLRGCARVNGQDLWQRSAENAALPVVRVPAEPLILPTTGQNNLTCFHDGQTVDYGRHILEGLVFDSDAVTRICETPDATRLSSGQKKTLSLARAFLLTPDLYLMDRPEDGLSANVIPALVTRLNQERRLGRTVVMVTENRALLDACDRMIVMEGGRIVDFGDARDIQSKATTGWSRFTGQRDLRTEDNLVLWIRSQFKRGGDDGNRRNVSRVAAEMLAFSCQDAARMDDHALTFEFKNFRGYCLIRMIDDGQVLSSGKLERVRQEIEDANKVGKMSPLAEIVHGSDEVDATIEDDRRVMTVRVPTYDPRLIGRTPA